MPVALWVCTYSNDMPTRPLKRLKLYNQSPQAPKKTRIPVVASTSTFVSCTPESDTSQERHAISTSEFRSPRVSRLDTLSILVVGNLDFRLPILLLLDAIQGCLTQYSKPLEPPDESSSAHSSTITLAFCYALLKEGA